MLRVRTSFTSALCLQHMNSHAKRLRERKGICICGFSQSSLRVSKKKEIKRNRNGNTVVVKFYLSVVSLKETCTFRIELCSHLKMFLNHRL